MYTRREFCDATLGGFTAVGLGRLRLMKEIQSTINSTNALSFWFFPSTLGGRLGFSPSGSLYNAFEAGDSRKERARGNAIFFLPAWPGCTRRTRHPVGQAQSWSKDDAGGFQCSLGLQCS